MREELLHTMRTQRHNFSNEQRVVYGILVVQVFQDAGDYLKKSVDEVAATSIYSIMPPGIASLPS